MNCLNETIFSPGLGAEKIVNLLIESGININATDDQNATALHKVAENGKYFDQLTVIR